MTAYAPEEKKNVVWRDELEDEVLIYRLHRDTCLFACGPAFVLRSDLASLQQRLISQLLFSLSLSISLSLPFNANTL